MCFKKGKSKTFEFPRIRIENRHHLRFTSFLNVPVCLSALTVHPNVLYLKMVLVTPFLFSLLPAPLQPQALAWSPAHLYTRTPYALSS